MAKHAAPASAPARHRSATRAAGSALWAGLRWATPRAASGTVGTVRRTAGLAFRTVRVSLVTLGMLALATAWVSLLLLLLTMSAVMPQGAELRRGVVAHMLQPLGEGAREALTTSEESAGVRAIRGLQARTGKRARVA